MASSGDGSPPVSDDEEFLSVLEETALANSMLSGMHASQGVLVVDPILEAADLLAKLCQGFYQLTTTAPESLLLLEGTDFNSSEKASFS